MVKLYLRLCYLCHNDGEVKPAVATYKTKKSRWTTNPNKPFDVCQEHMEIVKKEGHEVAPIPEDERMLESVGVAEI